MLMYFPCASQYARSQQAAAMMTDVAPPSASVDASRINRYCRGIVRGTFYRIVRHAGTGR